MYAQLNSPLPGLTVSQSGKRCCGMRGYHALGDFPVDTTYTDPGVGIVDPTITEIPPIDTTDLPLTNIVSPPLESIYPTSIGLEFTSNGDGTYTNIQTGQHVPYSIAQQITDATTGSATTNVGTTSAQNNLTIVDPTTGMSTTSMIGNLTTAAQALQAAGQLVNAAGKLTAQGQALAAAGNLYNPAQVSSTGVNLSSAMSSLTSWFTGSTLIAGFPNYGILGVGILALVMLPSLFSGKKRRKR